MESRENLNEINEKIRRLKQTAQDLNRDADDFPALSKNTARILASIKMLELNISDVVDLQESQKE
jgi:archaellum component FlaC